MLSDFGLSTVALAGHMDLGKLDSVTPFKKRMEFAKAVGTRVVHTNACRLSDQNHFFKNIEELSAFAESLDILIALENPGDGEDNLISSGKTGASVIQKIGSDYIRLNYDFGNTFIYSKGKIRPEEDYKVALPFSAHFHLKDVKQEKTGYFYSEIGKGVINYRLVLQSLSEKAPSVPMGIELPLCLKRGRDFIPWIDPHPVELSEIRRVLKGSLEFIKSILNTHGNSKEESEGRGRR